MSIVPRTVLLLKSEKSEGAVDKYESALKANDFEVIQVNTLTFTYRNIANLTEKLRRPHDFSGLLLSSPRCVNAVRQAASGCPLEEWKPKSNFVVGEATYQEALDKLGLSCAGKETGNAVNLAKLIVTGKSDYTKPFLFPHGNLKTDTLELELGKEGLSIEGVLVYDTNSNPNVGEELARATDGFSRIPEFVVFFSPSGLRGSIEWIRRVPVDLDLVKFVAIGPVTELAVTDHGLNVHGVAKTPTPGDVLNAIMS